MCRFGFITRSIAASLTMVIIAFFPSVTMARSIVEPKVQGFCGNYVQTSSNAGPCPSCKLQIADNPKLQKYFVESNNGWSAELTWVEGDASVATGSGQWKSHIAPPYGGKKIDIDMNEQGNTLSMTMSVSDRSVPGVIKVTYYCLDAHRQTGFNPAPPPSPTPPPPPKPFKAFAAGSWGGVVRNGPGMGYRRLGSLNEGETITILENTGVMMNGYPWFRIHYRGNQTGYKWGGILCATDYKRAGLHQECPKG